MKRVASFLILSVMVVMLAGNVDAMTTFYVDPTYTGGSNDGSAAHPWLVLGSNAAQPGWVAINAGLVNDDVTVFFSARTVGQDVPEVQTTELRVFRTDSSTHRLTLNGMAKWNTCDTLGAWLDYQGLSQFKIAKSSVYNDLGWVDSDGRKDYITLTGFEVTGVGARTTFGGSHLVIEHLNIHDVTFIGPTVHTHPCMTLPPACVSEGDMTDVIFQDNTITNGYGEGLYLNCNYQPGPGACPSYLTGPTHFIVQRNVITNAGHNGGQGDGIDIKVGMRDSIIRDNVIVNSGGVGISYSGTYGTDPDGMVIERNMILNAAEDAIAIANVHGAMIRNNVLVGMSGRGVVLNAGSIAISQDAKIYNNTLYTANGGSSLYVAGANNTYIRNNILYTNKVTLAQAGGVTGTDSGYNLLKAANSKSANWHVELNDLYVADPAAVLTSPSTGDVSLLAGSPAIDAGFTIDACGALDILQTLRPQGLAWDIGAYEKVQ
mgnify:CR=1 FL=1